jgi:hypothetical protein
VLGKKEKRSRRIGVAALQPAPHSRHLLDLQRGGGERILHIEFSGWTRGSERPSPCMLSRDISAPRLGIFSSSGGVGGSLTYTQLTTTHGGKMSKTWSPGNRTRALLGSLEADACARSDGSVFVPQRRVVVTRKDFKRGVWRWTLGSARLGNIYIQRSVQLAP